jgi:hypothetical protein
MPDRLVTSLTTFRLAILCATIGLVQILAQIGLAQISPACAASFTTAVTKAGQTIVLLDGKIERGDGQKLALIVAAADDQGRAVSALYLNSPGGTGSDDYAMAALVKRLKISTIVADGAECASACFTVFAAGHKKFAGYLALIGVPPAIVGKLVLTPPDLMAWLMPPDLRSMNVTVTAMLRWPVPLAPAARRTPLQLTPFKPDGLSWLEYVAEASELSRRTFGPTYLTEACSLLTALCSRSFVFIDAEDIHTYVTTVEEADGHIVQREVCKSNLPGSARSCFDWDTLEKYYSVMGSQGREKRKRIIGGSD